VRFARSLTTGFSESLGSGAAYRAAWPIAKSLPRVLFRVQPRVRRVPLFHFARERAPIFRQAVRVRGSSVSRGVKLAWLSTNGLDRSGRTTSLVRGIPTTRRRAGRKPTLGGCGGLGSRVPLRRR